MKKEDYQKLTETAQKMAIHNIWGENAYKINMTILKVDSNNTAAYTRLAKYYKLKGNSAEVKKIYTRVLEIDPNHRGAINNLMDIEKDEKEDETVDKIKASSEMFHLGQSSMKKAKYSLAVKLFSKAFSVDPTLKHAVGLAQAYKQIGGKDKIEMLYMQMTDGKCQGKELEEIDKAFADLR